MEPRSRTTSSGRYGRMIPAHRSSCLQLASSSSALLIAVPLLQCIDDSEAAASDEPPALDVPRRSCFDVDFDLLNGSCNARVGRAFPSGKEGRVVTAHRLAPRPWVL